MSTKNDIHHHPDLLEKGNANRRPFWRQRIVDAERGFVFGFRGDSTLFAHFFAIALVIALGVMTGLAALEWAVIVISIATAMAAELFQHVLKTIWSHVGHHLNPDAENALHLANAAVIVAILGASLAISIVILSQLWDLFSV